MRHRVETTAVQEHDRGRGVGAQLRHQLSEAERPLTVVGLGVEGSVDRQQVVLAQHLDRVAGIVDDGNRGLPGGRVLVGLARQLGGETGNRLGELGRGEIELGKHGEAELDQPPRHGMRIIGGGAQPACPLVAGIADDEGKTHGRRGRHCVGERLRLHCVLR